MSLPNGRPVPEPYEESANLDITLWIAVAYFGEIAVSWVTAVLLIWSMNSDLALFGSSNDGECSDAVGPETYATASIVFVKAVLSSIILGSICYSETIQQNDFVVERVLLRRLPLRTLILKNRCLLGMLYLCDLLTLVCFVMLFPIRSDAIGACRGWF